jgi:hypothetical protein
MFNSLLIYFFILILYKMATQNGRARNVGKLVNRTNTCGGDNKTGLPSKIGAIANRISLGCKHSCPKNLVCKPKTFIRMNYRAGKKYLG